MANGFKRPPMDVDQLLDVLSNEGLVETVAALRS
jgi:hypothetical protein